MLQTNIVINSRVGNGFANVGSTLMEMSSLVSGLSQQLIDFGKESTQVYRNYESAMRDAEVALSTAYGQGSKELAQVMANLDAAATQWAASTISTQTTSQAQSQMPLTRAGIMSRLCPVYRLQCSWHRRAALTLPPR